MADELDSGSSVGYRVWVQVPSPAYKKQEHSREYSCFFVHIIANNQLLNLFSLTVRSIYIKSLF